jgi:peptidoglycan/LPS O-acetylase OafA/YrhL
METLPQAKFGSIQALRAAAANAVVVCHIIGLHSRFYPALLPYDGIANWMGQAGVYCFFFISGFVVLGAASKSTWQSFFLSRITRVYPIYWIYLLLSIAFAVLWQQETLNPARIAAAVALIPVNEPQILPVAWSLVFEVYFYAVVGLLIMAKANLRIGLLCWAALVVVIAPISPFLGSPMTLLFIAGGLLSFDRKASLTRALSAPVPTTLCRIGDASYSLYLSHFLVIAAISRLMFWRWPDQLLLSALVCFIAANGIALCSYRSIELPLLAVANSIRFKNIGRSRMPAVS